MKQETLEEEAKEYCNKMAFNPILEMARLYKKYLKHCQRKNIKPLPKECMSIDMLNRILNDA